MDSNKCIYNSNCLLFGQYVPFFGISIDALRIAGGIIIVSSGFHYQGNLLRNEVSIKKPKRMHNSEMILPDPAGNTHASWTWINLLIAFYQEHNTTMEIIISSIAILAIAVAILSF
jgi:multiple antibiotic resistance protein